MIEDMFVFVWLLGAENEAVGLEVDSSGSASSLSLDHPSSPGQDFLEDSPIVLPGQCFMGQRAGRQTGSVIYRQLCAPAPMLVGFPVE